MIITVTLTPALDKTVVLPSFRVDQVNRIESLRLDPGGKGINVSKVLDALGTRSLATGILGGGTGRYIEKSLKDMGIACDFVWVEQETRTNLKVVDPVEHTNTDINEPGAPVSPQTLEAVFEKVKAAAGPGDIVVLAGKAPAGAGDGV
ncbi:MAG: 1-phosphofructokinase, partial [Clostridia bacterium]|nr:1-phosphofructokinase [Clostridia bacterium]